MWYRYRSAYGNRAVDKNIDVVIKTDRSIDTNREADGYRSGDGEIFLVCWDSENQQQPVLTLDFLITVTLTGLKESLTLSNPMC